MLTDLVEAPVVVQRSALGDQVAEVLRRQICSRKLNPGDRLIETKLAADLGVSRGPVRDAIKALAADGLVDCTIGGGARIVCPSRQDLLAVAELRLRMEDYAIELATNLISEEGIANLRSLAAKMGEVAERGDRASITKIDLEFHRTIWTHSGSTRLADILSLALTPLAVWHGRIQPKSNHSTKDNHARIAEAVALRNVEQARAALRDHLERVRARVLEVY